MQPKGGGGGRARLGELGALPEFFTHMTYTHKLARRLALSRASARLTVLVLLAACAGDATAPAPDQPAGPTAPPSGGGDHGFRVLPGSMTIEVNQRIRFRGEFNSARGHVRQLPMHWKATGGTVEVDGTFYASKPGTYRVIGRILSPQRKLKPDTSLVAVVKRQPDLVAIQVTPRTPTLAVADRRTFTAVGRLPDSTNTAIAVKWRATGGTITEAGIYSAGDTPGSYQVIATNRRGTLADTVPVTIQGQGAAEPPEIPPPPAPVASRVVLRPASLALATNTNAQFAAFGRTDTGDSVAVDVTFSATGGTVNSTGLFTAGPAAGSYRVIATSNELADTALVTLASVSGGETSPPQEAPAPGAGIPFGPSGMTGGPMEVVPFTMTLRGVAPANIVTTLRDARSVKTSLILNMTGGKHEKYMTNGAFDYAKWVAAMDEYKSDAIRQAVANAVADGTIVGNSVMDEPHVSGAGDGNTWGPVGTMTKARVDQMCAYVKQIFPTLPTGVAHRHDVFEPTKSYRVCDFIIAQYSSRLGSVTEFRDAGLALARRDGHAIVFGMNILNGGTQDKDGVWNCSGTGGIGTYSPNCRMTPTQIREVGLTLGPAGCGLTMWRFDQTFVANLENQRAFGEIGTRLSAMPGKACRRA
jgi:hypothetical protein